MTREEIKNTYEVVDGRITSPGKFEAEPVYTPYFWEFYLDGFVDEEDGELLTFHVDEDDRKQFPELVGVDAVQLWQDDQGFIYCGHLCTREGE